jgi:Leucine-rich repeat (LRR) protein
LETKKLDLSCNQLTEVEAKFFEGLFNLKEIYLSRNQIKFVNSNAFQSINNLIEKSKKCSA